MAIMADMHKLTATKYHMNNYLRIEQENGYEALKLFQKNPNSAREAFELIFELEAFLFQIKSSLDMLVKILDPLIGKGRVKTITYGKAGETLIKGLAQLKRDKQIIAWSKINDIDLMIKLINDNKIAWIEKVVDMRDDLNHMRGLQDFKFLPVKTSDNIIIAEKPKYLGMETVDFMELVYSNNLAFHQDFMSISMILKAPPDISLMPINPEQAIKKYGDNPLAKYIKYCLGLNIKR
jgi:hypothetical protein